MTPFPRGIRSHAELLEELFAGDGDDAPVWVLWFDGMRYDTFADMYDEYLDARIRPAWNHDVGYTGDWADCFLRRDFDRRMGFFSPVPLWGFEHADYDEREYFDIVPAPDAYDATPVADRLEALGYRPADSVDESGWCPHPRRTNAVVRDYLPDAGRDIEGGIIRYVAPHPPLVGLGELTDGRGKISAVKAALETGELTPGELGEAYRATARLAFDAATDLIPDLAGETVITADHGECLAEECCEQVFHARGHEKCACLTTVPWARVDGVRS